jgi:hypothetical protein
MYLFLEIGLFVESGTQEQKDIKAAKVIDIS